MTDLEMQSRSPDEQRSLSDRAADARSAAHVAVQRYVSVRRQCHVTVGNSHEVVTAAHALREQLRDSVASYAAVLRADLVLPERVIVLMKSAVVESDPLRDQDHRAVLEDVVRWAVDAYYAA